MTGHAYDTWGWYAGPAEPGNTRCVPDAPPILSVSDVPGAERANWSGFGWVVRPYVPPAPPDLTPLRDAARERVNAWRDEQEAAGIVFEHAGRRWDGGIVVRTRLTPLLSLPALPPGFFWTDADDVDVPMTAADLAALHAAHEAAIVAQGFAFHVRQRAMKAEIDAIDDADALAAYTPGWPAPQED